jgi:hypothetical protein
VSAVGEREKGGGGKEGLLQLHWDVGGGRVKMMRRGEEVTDWVAGVVCAVRCSWPVGLYIQPPA